MHPTLSRAFAFLSRNSEASEPPMRESRLQRLVARQKPGRVPPPGPHWGDASFASSSDDQAVPLYDASVYAADLPGQREA